MNTGIGDAVNLGWKLGQVLNGRASSRILDTYEQERIGFAKVLIDSTDKAFTGVVAPGLAGETLRKFVMPLLFTVATRFTFARHAAFEVLSQTRIHYEDSALSEGHAGGVRAGDRLPWVPFEPDAPAIDNFESLNTMDWQVHVYGTAGAHVISSCSKLGLPLHEFHHSVRCEEAGLKRDALYLVRPDGHVALASAEQVADALERFVAGFSLRFGNAITC